MDFSAICRTCMRSNNVGLNPIFMSEEAHERFSSAIYSCTGIQIKFNDGLPQNMCIKCMNQFNNTLKFRRQCKQTETKLLKIKTEFEIENSSIVANNKQCDNENVGYSATINKSSIENSSNFTSIKSEFKSIKTESLELEEEDKPLKYLIHKNNESLLKRHDLINNHDEDEIDCKDIDYVDEDTDLFNNRNDFKSNTCDDTGRFPCLIYSYKTKDPTEKLPKITQNEHEEINTELEISDSIITEDIITKDVPYIVTDSVSKKTKRVVCKLCQKELSIRSIDSHMMRTHPGADERKVKCELCDRYVMKEKLNRHKVMMHGNIGVRCGYCKSEFKTKEVLMDHVATCSAKNRKRKVNESGRALAECDICKMTMQRASLKKHQAVKHAGLRPVCEHCGKSFGNKFRLNEHYRAKHGYEKFKCSYCDFRSAGIMAMRNHERRHRGEKPFVCETCGAKFHAAYLLMQHKYSHRTEKLVKCDLCPASFKANNNLHMHKLTCHSSSYYSCSVCARSYKCRYYAVKHVRLAHSASEPRSLVTSVTH